MLPMVYMTVLDVPTHCSPVSLLFLFLQFIFAFLYPGFPQSLDRVHCPTAYRDPRHDDTEPQISPHTHMLGQQISHFTGQENACAACCFGLI